MKDLQAHLKKLREDAAECKLISDLATDNQKRELFARLATHLATLADEIETVVSVSTMEPELKESRRRPA